MPDNKTTVDAAGATFTIAFKDASSVFYPRSLTTFDVSGTPTDVSTAAPLPVVQTGALPAGDNNIGNVDVVSLPALAAGTNNIGDVDVLTVPTTATTTRAYDYANGQTVTAGSSSSASSAITATEICVHNAGDVRAYIRTGAATPTASVAATSMPLEAGEKIHIRITSGHLLAAIRDGASDCAIRILPVA